MNSERLRGPGNAWCEDRRARRDCKPGLGDRAAARRRTLKPAGLLLVFAAGLALLVGCRGGDEDGNAGRQTWRMAIEEVEGSIQDQYARKFAELLAEKSGGAIELTVYPYGTLGTSDEVTEQLRRGTLQMAMSSPGHLGTLIPEVQVFLLHFLFSSDEAVNQKVLADKAVVERFDALYDEKGLKLLAFIQEGWMAWTAQRALRTPDDFRGLKIRVMTSPLLLAAYEAYGASPVAMPYAEVYSGLQLKMIDGQVNPIFAIEEMSFYEVCDWLITPHHAPYIASVAGNAEWFAGLPPEQQGFVRAAIDELHTYNFELQQRVNRERLAKIRERRPDLQIVEELSEEARARFAAASEEVRAKFRDLAGARGAEMLDLLERTVARHAGE